MITYDWIAEQLEFYPEHDGLKNVVFSINWRCNAQDGEFSATNYGSLGVEYSADAPFVAYKDLTSDLVVNWIKQTLGAEQVAKIESGLSDAIDLKKTPKSIAAPPPWLSVTGNAGN